VAAVEKHTVAGEFLAFAGFEFRGKRGDTAVVFQNAPAFEEIDRPEWADIRALWAGLAGREVLTIPHFHNPGRGLDEWWAGPEDVEPVLEIISCHGSYERQDALESGRPMMKGFREDRCGAWMLANGYRYGLVGNGDDHKGHVGASGVTAVYSESLEPDAIFTAYRARHVYASTNARIRLLFTANGALMGSVLDDAAEKRFAVEVVGEGELKKIDLFRNAEPYQTLIPQGREFRDEIVVRDDGPANWYVRATQKDNQVAYSSPVWFT
jgi:hypothetical protein